MGLLEELRACNDVDIFSVREEPFRSYGRVIEGYDVTEWMNYMEQNTTVPKEGNCYVPTDHRMEVYPMKKEIQTAIYGGMPIQVGYCNGKNTTYNGFEYHKGSELNIAVTDFMLVLGHSYDIRGNSYDVAQAEVFFVPRGTMIEMYQTTLHLSPLRVCDAGFKDIVILPQGTNTPLTEEEKQLAKEKRKKDRESVLLLQKNKWVIAHPQREPLIRQGAHPGVTGENKELFYPGYKGTV